MGNVERVMERVHRLLAIANDPAASDNEQHIALEQAQRLMNKHAIEEWQLEEDHDDVEIIERRIRLETNPCNRYMAQLANIVAHGNRCRAAYECRRAGNGRDVVSTVWIYGARVDVDKTESIWTAMETSRAAMWRERARTTPRAKANAAWRNGYYRGFQEEIARRYQILRREMESDGTGKELVTVRGNQVDQWVEKHVTFSDRRPKLSKPTGSPASPPTGTDDRTGHARPSDSRRPARSPIGLWKSRKTPAKYHTCVIYLGYRQGIGQPVSPQ